MTQQTMTIPATLQAVSQFSAGLEDTLANLSMEVRVSTILALQELCVNIVKHAYAGLQGSIEIQLDLKAGKISVLLLDQAPNHFVQPETIELPDPLDLPEHGMGMYLIHLAFDVVEYEPLPGGNCWRLVKHLKQE